MSVLHVRRTRSQKADGGVSARVRTISTGVARSDTSRQLSNTDEFSLAVDLAKTVIGTPYDISTLLALFEKSNMLRQCVEAMVVNIASYGWEVAQASEDTPIDPDERLELQSFIDNANYDESLVSVHKKLVRDRETIGFGFLEIVRDRTGRVSIMRPVTAATIRLLPKHPDSIPVTYDVARGRRTSLVTELRRFRTYVQMVAGTRVYFKEFGDPRQMDYRTGEFGKVPLEFRATELIHFRQESEDSYGTPRWISQLPSILGSREAEEVNLRYFEDNTVPPMIMSVAGGRLTSQSYNELKKMLQQQRVGKDRQNQVMLIEAVPEREGLDDKGSVTLKIDKLTDARPSDGLFKEYDDANQTKIRSSFRLPPVVVGLSQDVNYATAQVSAFVAETQVFYPERRGYDEVYNKRFVNHAQGLNLKTVCLRSKASSITNPEQVIKSLTALNVMGAVTPRTSLDAANRVLQLDLPKYPEVGTEGYDTWMDEPIVFVTRGTASQAGQAAKDAITKQVEGTGDTGPVQPEHGQE